MAQPKRRHSRSRSRLRRNAPEKRLQAPLQTRCGECGAVIEPHTACRKCGTFRGKRAAIKGRRKEEAK